MPCLANCSRTDALAAFVATLHGVERLGMHRSQSSGPKRPWSRVDFWSGPPVDIVGPRALGGIRANQDSDTAGRVPAPPPERSDRIRQQASWPARYVHKRTGPLSGRRLLGQFVPGYEFRLNSDVLSANPIHSRRQKLLVTSYLAGGANGGGEPGHDHAPAEPLPRIDVIGLVGHHDSLPWRTMASRRVRTMTAPPSTTWMIGRIAGNDRSVNTIRPNETPASRRSDSALLSSINRRGMCCTGPPRHTLSRVSARPRWVATAAGGSTCRNPDRTDTPGTGPRPRVETAEEVRDRVLEAARHLPPERLGTLDRAGVPSGPCR